MANSRQQLTAVVFGALVGLALPVPAWGCNIPVFRYALEKWNADTYEVVVLHRGPLSPEEKALVEKLTKLSAAEPPAVNFSLEQLDLATQPEEQVRELLATLPGVELPAVLVRYPALARLTEPAWVGGLRTDAVNTLLDSPTRRELVRRLVRGDSAVWLFLESGDPKRDEPAARLLQEQLARLEKELKLPQLTDDPEDRLSGNGPPLKLGFSHLRLKRTDPAEVAFVHLLLHSEPDLAGAAGPMIFPVFGRGRVPYALVGAGITADNLEEAGRFIVGPCTCKVKEQNPGVDLLVAADWEGLLAGHRLFKEKAPPPLGSLSALAPADAKPAAPPPAIEPVADVVPAEMENPDEGRLVLLRNGLAGLVAGLALVSLFSYLFWGKNRDRG